VRSSGFTRTLFSIAHVRNGQSCSLGVSIRPKRECTWNRSVSICLKRPG
jgi:hypothetical protein